MFNSDYNPYVLYEDALDRDNYLVKREFPHGTKQENDEGVLKVEAPKTITYGDEWTGNQGEKLEFKPIFKPMPELILQTNMKIDGVFDVDEMMKGSDSDSSQDEEDQILFLPTKNQDFLTKKQIIPDQ